MSNKSKRYDIQDNTYVAPYKPEPEKPSDQGEIRELAPNELPLAWQFQTASDNYDAIHDNLKGLWDRYVVPPEAVQEANDYYETELYKNHPYLAGLGSALTGDIYQGYRDLQTDPANLVAGEALRMAGKGKNAIMGAVEDEPKIRAYIKRMTPEKRQEILDRYGVKSLNENMRDAYNAKLDKINAEKAMLADITQRYGQMLEDKIPLTPMAQQPHPDQEKYMQLLRMFKDTHGLR